jgi:hypothetical protein
MPDPLDLHALEKKAKKATPGPWFSSHGRGNPIVQLRWVSPPGRSVPIAECPATHGESYAARQSNAAYIAAVSPDVVLRLIATLRRLATEVDAANELGCKAINTLLIGPSGAELMLRFGGLTDAPPRPLADPLRDSADGIP